MDSAKDNEKGKSKDKKGKEAETAPKPVVADKGKTTEKVAKADGAKVEGAEAKPNP